MAKTSMEITMSDDLKARLVAIAPRVGRTVEECAEDALNTFVEDHEDGLLAQEVIDRKEPTVSLQKMREELGLDDRDIRFSKKTA